MLRHALLVFALCAPAAARAEEPDVLPAAFRKAAIGVWARIGTDLRQGVERDSLLRALAACRQDPTAMREGTIIMPRGKYVVRANMGTREVVAIAAAKAGQRRGRADPWALATDRGYTAVAFVSRGGGAEARRFMLDSTGIYLRCGGLPKASADPESKAD